MASQGELKIECHKKTLSYLDLFFCRRLQPKREVRSCQLADTLSRILWMCGDGKQAVVTLAANDTIISGGGRYKSDGITETVSTFCGVSHVAKYLIMWTTTFECW